MKPQIEKPEGDIPFALGIEDLTVGEGDEDGDVVVRLHPVPGAAT